MQKKLESPIHFIGIGGSGMAPLAELALEQGYSVQGTDIQTSDTTERLVGLGAKIFIGHDAKNVGSAKSVIYSSAIKDDNNELLVAKKQNLKIFHRSDLLVHFSNDKKLVSVSGTHGKTTSSAMISHVLKSLGCDPTTVIGGKIISEKNKSSSLSGKGDFFVAEVDESDGSILKYKPFIGVLTNVALDHMDFFKSAAELQEAFKKYLTHIDSEGAAIIGWDDKLTREVGREYEGNRLAFGFMIGSDVRALEYKCADGKTFFTALVERDRFPCELNMIGKHNVLNALCALAVARSLELDCLKAAESLKSFPGVQRRLNLLYEEKDLKVFDDYAHNPGKISACVSSLKESWPNFNVTIVYQPHRYSRLDTMYEETLSSFESADFVYVLPVYSAGESPSKEYSPKQLALDLSKYSRTKTATVDDLPSFPQTIIKDLKKPSIVLSLGAGDVWKITHKLRDILNAEKKS